MHDHHEVRRGFTDGNPKSSDLVRKSRLDDGNSILNENLGLIDIHAGLEHDVDGQLSIAGRLGTYVEHVVDAIHLLFDRRGDRFGNDFGGSARKRRLDGDRRRHDLRIFRDRKGLQGDRSGDRHDRRKHGRKDRSFDEEVREPHGPVGSFGRLFSWWPS